MDSNRLKTDRRAQNGFLLVFNDSDTTSLLAEMKDISDTFHTA